ncbi:MAG TPA: 1,4-dihydroxy-6-naphthoate synthase [Gaiellales bacterium]|nr:1,4-dihydroxy-6-naphthoate synthase [Gaiellales bacterium]
MKLRVGISPCPNDTFAFHAILERRIDMRGFDLDVELLDVQQLNDGLFGGRYDIAKASFHAALLLSERFVVLSSGAALGFGVGPLLVAARPETAPSPGSRVLCPGATTTATLLYHCLHPHQGTIDQAVFTDIGPALLRGDADLGVLIHEGRLTYQRDGLMLVEDLGTSFERLADAPVPLGGILADRALPDGTAAEFAALLRESIAYGWANRDEALATIRRHAQEMDESVIWPYVELYVNDHTVELGSEGARALEVLEQTGRAAGLFAGDLPPLTVVG